MNKIEWNKYFDHIFALSLVNNTDRRADAIEDWERLGLLDCGIFEWKLTVDNPLYNYIWTNPYLPAPKWWLGIKNALNCTLGHYEIMLQSLALGYKKVLILEDDARFHKDVNVVKRVLDAVPEYDICLLDKFTPMPKDLLNDALANHRVNDEFISFDTVRLWSCACYGVSEKAMKSILEQQTKNWCPADDVTNIVDNWGKRYKTDGLTRVAAVTNIAVQDQHYKRYKSQQEYDIDVFIYQGVADKSDYNVKNVEPPKFD